MTSYTALTDTALSQGKPVTQSMMRALRDNPLAIAEGSSGAPVIVGVNPAASVTLSSAASSITFTDIPPSDVIDFEILGLAPSNTGTTFQMQTSSNNGSTWTNFGIIFQKMIGTGTTLTGESGTNAGQVDLSKAGSFTTTYDSGAGLVKLLNNGNTLRKKVLWHFLHGDASTALTNVSGAADIQQTAVVNAVRFFFSAGNIANGKITARALRSKVAN